MKQTMEELMKKLVVIIIILILVFVGMIIYKNITISTNNNISVEEINQIETYLVKIYMWKEITGDALPCFDDINQANETWIWEAVKKNLEDYEFSYEQINSKKQELFGEKLTKDFPKEGTDYLTYNEETNEYYATGVGLDQQEDEFLLNNITKTDTGYEIEIVEYLEDYSQTESDSIIIRNIAEDEIGKVSSLEEESVKELIKNNLDKFTKKKVKLRKENEQLYVESVSKIEEMQ